MPSSSTAPLDEIDQTARTRDQHVDTAAQLADLRLVADPAVDGDHATAARLGERQQVALDLGGELAGRREHECARTQPAGAGHALDHRDAERERLARAGRGAARDVAAGEGVGDGRGLDGERLGDAALVERVDEVGGNAEIGKAG